MDQEGLLRRCPNLRAVEINPGLKQNLSLTTLVSLVREGHLRHLEEISLCEKFQDAEMAACFQAMTLVTKLKLFQPGFGELSFLSLMPHFATLKELVMFCIPGMVVQTVLESCPLLTFIEAPRIEASRIVAGKRWTCLNLRAFHVPIVLDSPTHSVGLQSRMVFVQLARLTRLERLVLSCWGSTKVFQSIDLRRESGLTQLASLRNMQVLVHKGTIQHMSADDCDWMRQHWKNLVFCEGVVRDPRNYEIV